MTEFSGHPAAERLDMWRAGLIEAAAAGEIERHVAQCGRCRRHGEMWRSGAPDGELPAQLAGRLRARRREVLAGRRRRSRAAPRLLVGAAAALALAVSVGVFVQIQGPAQRNAGIDVAAGGDPNLYAELDFYIWLADQQPEAGPAGNGTL